MSKYELILNREAEFEIEEAYSWYDSCVKGLGSEYLQSIDECFSLIVSNPLLFPAVHKTVRMALLKRFPYEVFYVIDDERIFVLAVFHAKRNPKNWIDRI